MHLDYISQGSPEETYLLMQFLRPRSPTVCCQQTGDPGKLVVQFSPSPKAQEQGAAISKGREDTCPRASTQSKLALALPFCSIQALDRLGDAHLHW